MNKNTKIILIIIGIVLLFAFFQGGYVYQVWTGEPDIELGTTNYDRCIADANYYEANFPALVTEWRCWRCPLKDSDTTRSECRLACGEACSAGANCLYPTDCNTNGCVQSCSSYYNDAQGVQHCGAYSTMCHPTDRSYWEPSAQGCKTYGGYNEAYAEIIVTVDDNKQAIVQADARYNAECIGNVPIGQSCSQGQYYDIATSSCKDNPCFSPSNIPDGYYWDSSTCSFRYICNINTQVWNTATQQCMTKPPQSSNLLTMLLQLIINIVTGIIKAITG